MQCITCEKKAITSHPALCSEHITSFVKERVSHTIEEFQLIKKGEKICVAASGGKDSITLLDVLHSLGHDVSALAIDEGIAGYRQHTLTFLKSFCQERNIPLRIVSFAQDIGQPLDNMIEGRYPCSVCGVFRRQLLNKHAQGFDVIATGHNLDDEAQVVLMNLIKSNKDLYRTHVRTPDQSGFVPRIKPLMFIPEKIVRAYTIINNIDVGFDECPYVQKSLRAQIRDALNVYESEQPGMKEQLVKAALRISTHTAHALQACKKCGEPSAHSVCRACTLKKELGLI